MPDKITVDVNDLNALLYGHPETGQYKGAVLRLDAAVQRQMKPIKRGDWLIYEPPSGRLDGDWAKRVGRRVLVISANENWVCVSDENNPLDWWSSSPENFRHE